MTPKTPACVEVGDIYRTVDPSLPKDEQAQITAQNAVNRRIYLAIAHILKQDFDVQNLPADPAAFCQLPDTNPDKARYAAIHGLMLADNYSDPSMGKTTEADGDDSVPDPATGEVIVIAKRFSDAVVLAVQEYTQRSKLFHTVFGFLQDEARESNKTLPSNVVIQKTTHPTGS
jgi:hypothetical protein